MIELICEVWCSPSRQEIYSKKMITTNTTEDHYIDDELSEYLSWTGDFWYDAFGDDYLEIGGLYKVVSKFSVEFINEYDYEGFPETRTNVFNDIIFKSKCSCFGELKYHWLSFKSEEKQKSYEEKVLLNSIDSF